MKFDQLDPAMTDTSIHHDLRSLWEKKEKELVFPNVGYYTEMKE